MRLKDKYRCASCFKFHAKYKLLPYRRAFICQQCYKIYKNCDLIIKHQRLVKRGFEKEDWEVTPEGATKVTKESNEPLLVMARAISGGVIRHMMCKGRLGRFCIRCYKRFKPYGRFDKLCMKCKGKSTKCKGKMKWY